MACSNDARSNRRLSAIAATGLACSALLVLGTIVTSAYAGDRHDDRRGGERRSYYGHAYGAPPIVYGSPYYAPPVVYGPGIGVQLPGIAIGIR
jgi:hypothetical protein